MRKGIIFCIFIFFLSTLINGQVINGETLNIDGKKILKIWGTHYERGYATGYLFGEEIKAISEDYFIGSLFGGSSYQYENIRTYFLNYFQIEEKYISETEGLIDGMIEADVNLHSNILGREIDADDILFSNAVVDIVALQSMNSDYDFGCSSLSSWGSNTLLDPQLNGDLVITRNMDWTPHPLLVENHLLVVNFPSEADEVNWISFTFPGFIGGLSAININGLCAFMNMGNHNEHPNTFTYHPILLSVRNGIEVYDYDGNYEIDAGDVEEAISDKFQLSGSIIHAANSQSGMIIECNNENGIAVRDDNDNTEIPLEHLAATNHFRVLYPPAGCYRYDNISDSLSISSDMTMARSWGLLAGAAGVSNNLHTIQYAPTLDLVKWATSEIGTPAYQLEPTVFELEDLFTYSSTTDPNYLPEDNFLSVFPNPFHDHTELSFTLTRTSDVTLSIYNIKGHKIKTLMSEVLVQGSHSISWDGSDEDGKKISSGIYFYVLQTAASVHSKKVIMLK